MNVQVRRTPRADLASLISSHVAPNMDDVELRRFNQFVLVSHTVWYCEIAGDFIGMMGTIPPTLMSDRAYLWFYNNEKIKEHLFVFIRHSQIAIADALKDWQELNGHVEASRTKSIRWLKWLGAEFFEPEGKLIPFMIRRK